MDKKHMDQMINRLSKAKINEWEVKDQLLYALAIEQFFTTMEPLIEKYEPTKPFKMEIRRLDEI